MANLQKAAFKELSEKKKRSQIQLVRSEYQDEPPSFNETHLNQNESGMMLKQNQRASQYESQEITIDMTVDRMT